MSKSHRKAHRPDPTVGPVSWNPRTKEHEIRPAFVPSQYLEDRLQYRRLRRVQNQTAMLALQFDRELFPIDYRLDDEG